MRIITRRLVPTSDARTYRHGRLPSASDRGPSDRADNNGDSPPSFLPPRVGFRRSRLVSRLASAFDVFRPFGPAAVPSPIASLCWSHVRWLLLFLLFVPLVHSGTTRFVAADDPAIVCIGRFDRSDPKAPVFMYSGCTIRTVFSGTSAKVILRDAELKNFFAVIVDGKLAVLTTDHADGAYVLAQGLPNGRHTLEIFRRTEWHGGNTTFAGLWIDADATLLAPAVSPRRIEFIGDSYTCGYGDEGKSRDEHFSYATENNYLSFGALTARALQAEALFVCRSGIGMVQSYDGNKEFNMPKLYDEVVQGRQHITWDFSRYQPQVVVIDLSDNDYAKPLDRTAFVSAYLAFLTRLRGHYPEAKIVCVVGPSPVSENWRKWQEDVRTVVSQRRATDPKVYYFGISNFELHGSDWHPNLDEHQKVAAELAPFIKGLMAW